KVLTTGQAIRLSGPANAAQAIEPDPTAFMTAQELAAHSHKETQLRQQVWLQASQGLRRDPALLVYFDFQLPPPGNRFLKDLTLERQQGRDGAIVGCSWAPGRWPGKYGLEFKGVSDRVRLQVQGAYPSLTLLAWVRVDSLPNGNNSLLMADGWDEG